MAAPNVATYVKELFAGTSIQVEVIENEAKLAKEYPLLAAVNRAARGVERHHARVIFLTYEPEGSYDKTLVLVGKGITYDTGGADIKANGVMAGMHRDKCGAAAVAGFFQTLAALKPKNIKVLGAMSMVRNSVGSECYVADELITARSGVRVRVGNTDAEGRMVMTDVLCHMKEKVVQEKNPYLFTIATLTGHACLTVGDGYSIIMPNGPAKDANVGPSIQKAGEEVGDMFEVSPLRREDYEFHKGKSEYEDVLQCNNSPSSRTPRGHQGPAAFLIMTSGLDKHDINSEKPLKYCHIDIAASSGPFPGIPSGA
ncbi:putative aminopeptidase, partial [Stegodyphus mimosarum]